MIDRNRWIALYVLCVGMLMIVLNAAVVNVALPAIQKDLEVSQSRAPERTPRRCGAGRSGARRLRGGIGSDHGL